MSFLKKAPSLRVYTTNAVFYLALILFLPSSIMGQTVDFKDPNISLHNDPTTQEVSITVDGELFTKYLYHDNLEKPVLFPIRTTSGQLVTRGYPLIPMAGERTDHPHHLGLWLNYGDVNGLDFWNNSSAIPAEKKARYGEIRHQRIVRSESTPGKGILSIEANWVNSDAQILLKEQTEFVFSQVGNTRIIDRTTRLEAEEDILFKDNKEGMLGIRVTRALELPSDRPEIFTDAEGNPTKVKVLNNDGVSGDYLSSEGITGGAVWGTRATWMRLAGKIGDTDVAVVIIDHPDNPGYPTHWHARGYGLFAANPLGQHVFNKDLELNFALKSGESTTFKYRILVHDESTIDPVKIEEFVKTFVQVR